MESRGNDVCNNSQNKTIGNQGFGYTLHFGRDWTSDAYQAASYSYNTPDGSRLCDNFHTYTLIWASNGLAVFIDGTLMGNVTVPPSFYARGGLTGTNPWSKGTQEAPFDQEVMSFLDIHIICHCIDSDNYFKLLWLYLVLPYHQYGCWRHEWIFPRCGLPRKDWKAVEKFRSKSSQWDKCIASNRFLGWRSELES